MKSKNRRKFLFDALALSTQIIGANVVIYAIGSANKKFGGSLVAGAKVGSWVMTGGPYTSTEACVDLGNGIGLIKNPPSGSCTVGSTAHSFNTNKSLPNGGYCQITEKDFTCQ